MGLTAEAEDSLSADDSAHGVGGQALVDASKNTEKKYTKKIFVTKIITMV